MSYGIKKDTFLWETLMHAFKQVLDIEDQHRCIDVTAVRAYLVARYDIPRALANHIITLWLKEKNKERSASI